MEVFQIGNYTIIAERRISTCPGETTQKLTKKEAVNTLKAARTVQESGVARTQKLEPSLGAKLTTKLPNESWKWGRAGTLEEISQKTKKEKSILVSPLFPPLLSHVVLWAKPTGSQRANKLGQCSSLKNRAEQVKGRNGSESKQMVGQHILVCRFHQKPLHSITDNLYLSLLNEYSYLFI